jgi:PKD repeat protein
LDSTIDHSARCFGRLLRAARIAPLVLLLLVPAAPAVYADTDENARPVAAFTFSPSPAVAGETVAFTSTSSDPDGRVASQAWDLDDDRSYDDGSASTAARAFSSPGDYTVRLRVVDNDGSSRTTSRTVTVRPNAAPVAAFSATPADPETGQAVRLTSDSRDPDERPLLEEWDLDGDGAFDDARGREAWASFAEDGLHRVSLRVTDSGGAVRTSFKDLAVRNRPPRAGFGMSAASIDTGDPIEFTSTSTDPDGEIRSYHWDFDGDGAADATGPTARRGFADDGTRTVVLTVTDDDGTSASASRQVAIRNRAPSAAFGHVPATAVAGDEVVLSSASTDRDGAVGEHRWDLDGDGAFDDAAGAEVHTTFAGEGTRTIALQVVDDDGALSAPAFTSIDVVGRPGVGTPPSSTLSTPGRPPSGQPSTGLSAPERSAPGLLGSRLLDPFPRVRVRGVTTTAGVRIDVLSVRTAGGTRILVRCRGRGCPWARNLARASFSSRRVRVVRIPGFSRRHLRAGAVIEVFVTRAGMIGKYTSLRVRRLRAPARIDGCTSPGITRARRCPTG